METQWKRWSSSFCLLILGIFVLTKTKAELHSLEIQLTVTASPESPSDIFLSASVDDDLIASYDSNNKDLIVTRDRVSAPMRNFLIQQNREELLRLEVEVYRILKEKRKYYNWTEGVHTGQALMSCETDRGILVNSQIGIAFDGEDICQLDMKQRKWIVLKQEFEDFCPYQKDAFWEKAMRMDCSFFLKLLLQIVHLKEKTPPEVTVSRHHTPDGRIIFSCLATGFYPRSILLSWEKDGQLGVWGKESSSGTLPNADATYYLHVTLELPPGDSGKGYACLVDHSELKKPTVYPAPGESSRGNLLVVVLVSIAGAILVLSSLAVFITWKKKRGRTPLSQLEYSFPPLSSSTAL